MAAKLYCTVLVAVCAMSAGLAFPYGSDVEALQPSYEQQQQQQQHYGGEQHVQEEQQHEPRSYHFQYAVHDDVTGDVKSQNEVSDGRGTVRGTYSLLEADGSTRVVEYTADDEHGYRAEVKKIQPLHKHVAAPAAQPEYKFDYPEHQKDAEHVHYYPGETFAATH
ncbi:larval cuticle protein A2B-like [Sipha flava]|uniref:Larval cuticle protein A2B-like n=1 Tax=Sipha flava TaxID=143950 RepID=A0A8B8GN33_9HEMI|nr:larval cuticle protein A2B-like [Sipha flava]